MVFGLCLAVATGPPSAFGATNESAAPRTTAPALSKAYPQQCDESEGNVVLDCVEWTGSWPTGQVRAGPGSALWYSIKLIVCSDHPDTQRGCKWTQAAISYGTAYTKWVKVGKYSWYRSCHQNIKGGIWNCMSTDYSVYLGD